MNILTRTKLREFTDHELKVAMASIKQVQSERAENFLNQFSEGMPLAVKTENGNNYPAYVVRVNKKSLVIGFTTDSEYNSVTWFQNKNQRKWDVDKVKSYVRNGFVYKAFPSNFQGKGTELRNYNSMIGSY